MEGEGRGRLGRGGLGSPPLSALSLLQNTTSVCISSQMAKAPSKKSAKTVKAAAAGEGKKKRKASRTESYSTYIYRVMKQVHPGESSPSLLCPRAHPLLLAGSCA